MTQKETHKLSHGEESRLLVAQTDDRVLLRGLRRGDDAEYQSDGDRYAERDRDRHRRHDRVNLGNSLDADGAEPADEDSGDAAREADHHRLAQKLRAHVALR